MDETILVDQPTAKTTRKVSAATFGATIGAMAFTLIGGLLARVYGMPFDMPEVVAGWPMLGAPIGAWLAGYFTRERAYADA